MRQTSTLEFSSADRLDNPVMLIPAWVVLGAIFVIAMIVVVRGLLVPRRGEKTRHLRNIGKRLETPVRRHPGSLMRPWASVCMKTNFAWLALLACCAVPAGSPNWQTYLDESRASLQAQQQALIDVEDLGSYERWDMDQGQGAIVFSNGGVPALVARVVFVGSYAGTSKTWLWGWANPSVLPALTDPVQKVREFGMAKHYPLLINHKWDAQESDGWDMAAVTNRILGGKGVYRAPNGQTLAFFVITDLSKAAR